MPMRRLLPGPARFLALASLLVALSPSLSACSDDHENGHSSGGTSGTADTACARDTRKDTYVAGLSKAGAALTVKILDAQPAPPAKGNNTFTVQVLDGAGKPVDGATLAIVPFMPDHGHGSAVVPEVVAVGSEGKYTVSKVYLAMAGLWELRVSVQAPGATTSEVTFAFCLDG